MTSANDELQPPPKPRVSPLDFRNTDLVSRLLAATPPYLYNMPMVPNSYFFSEMLRSLVQAKAEAGNNARASSAIMLHQRRSRKRSWTQARAEYHQKASPKLEKLEPPGSMKWPPRTSAEKLMGFNAKHAEKPLELTLGKMPDRMDDLEQVHETKLVVPPGKNEEACVLESKPGTHMTQLMFPGMGQGQEANSNLILPPPPPIWYPPLYPAPYGIDPLHFFIDLRVSGHIYDGKNQREFVNNQPQTAFAPSTTVPPTRDQLTTPERAETNTVSFEPLQEALKQPRHASAFSVPIPASNKNLPMNLSNAKPPPGEPKEPTKFDVKSMGFDKNANRTGVNHVMNNIGKIYARLHKGETSEEAPKGHPGGEKGDCDAETEEEKQKRVKDLRALIGLELVVDYVNQAKPGRASARKSEGSSVEDLEDSNSDSPAVEVVALQDVDQEM